jgi:hypothetical protein
MNIRTDKPEFLERLNKVKPLLPEWYAKKLKKNFPAYGRHRFYSIKSGKTVDFAVLEAMEKMIEHQAQAN